MGNCPRLLQTKCRLSTDILYGRGLIGAVLEQKQGKWSRSEGCACWAALAAVWRARVYFDTSKRLPFKELRHPLMDKELTDRAAAIHDRLMQLRDSL